MKSSEKRLLLGFSGAALIAGSVIGFDFYRNKVQKLENERKGLELQVIEIDELLNQKNFWIERGQWMDGNQPLFTTQAQIKNQIYEDANSGKGFGVDIENIQLVEEAANPHYIQAGAVVRSIGTLSAIMEWLHELQRPEHFRIISDLKIQPHGEDETKVQCNFTLLKRYAPK